MLLCVPALYIRDSLLDAFEAGKRLSNRERIRSMTESDNFLPPTLLICYLVFLITSFSLDKSVLLYKSLYQ